MISKWILIIFRMFFSIGMNELILVLKPLHLSSVYFCGYGVCESPAPPPLVALKMGTFWGCLVHEETFPVIVFPNFGCLIWLRIEMKNLGLKKVFHHFANIFVALPFPTPPFYKRESNFNFAFVHCFRPNQTPHSVWHFPLSLNPQSRWPLLAQ